MLTDWQEWCQFINEYLGKIIISCCCFAYLFLQIFLNARIKKFEPQEAYLVIKLAWTESAVAEWLYFGVLAIIAAKNRNKFQENPWKKRWNSQVRILKNFFRNLCRNWNKPQKIKLFFIFLIHFIWISFKNTKLG